MPKKKEGLGQFADLREGLGQKEGNALSVGYWLSPCWVFLTCILGTSMIDFNTNKYIHNVHNIHLHDTYIYIYIYIYIYTHYIYTIYTSK